MQEGCDFIIGVDAHNPSEMLDEVNYRGCMELVESIGGKVLWK